MAINFDELSAVVTSDPAIALRFLQHFLPHGEVNEDRSRYQIGDFSDTAGTSAYIYIPSLYGEDGATGDKVSGPLAILCKLKNIPIKQAAEELQDWLKSEGVSSSTKETRSAAFPWSEHVKSLTERDRAELSKFRGWSLDHINRVLQYEGVAKINGFWCFPLRNKNGAVVGLDQLLAHPLLHPPALKQRWEPKPKGADRVKEWYCLGCDPERAELAIVCESRWDACSILQMFSDEEMQKICIFGATGAKQTKLQVFSKWNTLTLAIQNDEASWRWATQIIGRVGALPVKVVTPPKGTKDFNDLLKVGKLERKAFDKARPYSIREGKLHVEARPTYFASGGVIGVPEAVRKALSILGRSGEMFNVGKIATRLRPSWLPSVPQPETFNELFQTYAQTFQMTIEGPSPDKLNLVQIKEILESDGFRECHHLPEVRMVLQYPQLVQINGVLQMTKPGLQTMDVGDVFTLYSADPLPKIDFTTALLTLQELIKEFNFRSEADRSRMLALMIGPAMKIAGFLGATYPMAYFEGEEHGTGKSNLMTLIIMLYRAISAEIGTKSDGSGTGSLYNNFSAALMTMAQFITLDNHRGLLNLPVWESALTAGKAKIRASYSKELEVETSNRIFMMTTNGAITTPDLMDRTLPVNLTTRPKWSMTETQRHAEWRQRQPELLACIHSIMQQWVADGKPLAKSDDHRFKDWSEPVCGLIEHTCGLVSPLQDVMRDAKFRTDPTIVWAREIALAMRARGKLGQTYLARDLADFCRESKSYLPPGHYTTINQFDLSKLVGSTMKTLADHALTEAGVLRVGSLRMEIRKKELGDAHGNHPWQLTVFNGEK